MAAEEEKYYKIDRDLLWDFSWRTYAAYGLDEEDAKTLCSALIRSDMRGVKSHGLVRTPDYIDWTINGVWAKKTTPELLVDTPAVTVIDGHNGLGPVLATLACEMTMKKARECGIAYATVRNTNHFGETGLWSTKICEEKQDLIGFATTSTVAVCAAPGSMNAVVGSNPFAFSVPGGSFGTVCLDVACGTMAVGKIWQYKRLNIPLPDKSFIGPDGEYVTDPNKYGIGDFIMAPFGGHKGYGLSVIMESLTSFLSGGNFQGHDYIPGGETEPAKSSQSFMAINIGAFLDVSEYWSKMEEYIRYLHAQPVHADAPAILYPGEIEARNEAKARKEGVMIPAQVFEDIAALAEAKGIDSAKYRRYEECYDSTVQGA